MEMKKVFNYGFALAIIAMLACSCNKNQLDFSQLDSVSASGQWNLPIGNAKISLDRIMGQLSQNDLISYDANGNIQISYQFAMDTLLKGSAFMKYNDMNFEASLSLENPYQFVLDEPIEDMMTFDQIVELDSDVLRVKSAKIRSGAFVFNISSNLVRIEEVRIKSSSAHDADGTPFERVVPAGVDNVIDMAGVYFNADTSDVLTFHYEVDYLAYDFVEPQINFLSKIEIKDLCIQELTGSISRYETGFIVDESFSLPFDKVYGELKMVDARLMIKQRNSFDMEARIRIDTAMLLGNNTRPSMVFDENEYPVSIDVNYSPTLTNAFDELINLDLNTDFDKVYVSGGFVLNPDGFDKDVSLFDTSSIGLAAEGVLPLRFNIPGVYYRDTMDLNISQFKTPELIKEVLLYVTFDSEIPFNLDGQLYTYNSRTGQVTDSLLTNDSFIKGSFKNEPVTTETVISVTKERLTHLKDADKLLLKFKVDTDNQVVNLNLDDALGVILKADVIYDGELKY